MLLSFRSLVKAVAQRPGYGGLDDFEPAADDRRRCEADVFTEPGGPAIQARPRSAQA
jgi:hypothetical protein